jgi:hypothetical protein
MQTGLQWILMLLHVDPEAREDALKVYTVSLHLIEKCISSTPPSVPSLSTHAMMLPFLFRVLELLQVSQSRIKILSSWTASRRKHLPSILGNVFKISPNAIRDYEYMPNLVPITNSEARTVVGG